ncbi:MAG: DNA-directed RNA polymerase subunit omega, partial [Clostridia bacterium]|nr:DNA-directed RNA polymerase subunit omega [Clostridia bacterium]
MLNPNIGKLIQEYDNRYRLVIDVAHKAREIAKTMEEEGDLSTKKPVSLAINVLAVDAKSDEAD